MYEGYNRNVRAKLYMRFLQQQYPVNTATGNRLRRNQYLQVVLNYGHDLQSMLTSDPGTYAVFGNITTSVCNVCGSATAIMIKPTNYVSVSIRGIKTRIKCIDLYRAGKSSFYTSDVCLSLLLQSKRTIQQTCGCIN
jgi:hypothetical protein